MPSPGRRVAVMGCGRGEIALSLAAASPDDTIACFDSDPGAIAVARRAAARLGVADRVTFEVAAPAFLPGDGYDLVLLLQSLPPTTRSHHMTISINPTDLPLETSDTYQGRSAELGDYTVDFGSIPAGFTMRASTFAGLPDDACQCPHWGVLLKGEWRVPMTDGRTETVRAGEAYYFPPGHHFEVVEDSEYIEFSPTKELKETYAVVSRNR